MRIRRLTPRTFIDGDTGPDFQILVEGYPTDVSAWTCSFSMMRWDDEVWGQLDEPSTVTDFSARVDPATGQDVFDFKLAHPWPTVVRPGFWKWRFTLVETLVPTPRVLHIPANKNFTIEVVTDGSSPPA